MTTTPLMSVRARLERACVALVVASLAFGGSQIRAQQGGEPSCSLTGARRLIFDHQRGQWFATGGSDGAASCQRIHDDLFGVRLEDTYEVVVVNTNTALFTGNLGVTRALDPNSTVVNDFFSAARVLLAAIGGPIVRITGAGGPFSVFNLQRSAPPDKGKHAPLRESLKQLQTALFASDGQGGPSGLEQLTDEARSLAEKMRKCFVSKKPLDKCDIDFEKSRQLFLAGADGKAAGTGRAPATQGRWRSTRSIPQLARCLRKRESR